MALPRLKIRAASRHKFMNWINYNLGITATITLWAQAILVVLSCLIVAVLYARAKDNRLYPIVGVAVSHTILTLRGVTGLMQEVYPAWSAWGAAVIIAFLLTDYHLISLIYYRLPQIWRGKTEEIQ